MSAVDRVDEATLAETRGSLLLWVGVLTGPLCWVVHLLVSYSLEEWFACAPATRVQGQIVGISVQAFSVTLTTFLAALTAAAGVVSVRCLRAVGATGDERSVRARWMAKAGILNSALYLLIIILGVAPPLILGVCQGPP